MTFLSFLRTLTLQGKLLAGAAVLLFLIAIAASLYFGGKRDGRASERAKQAEQATQAVTEARKADEAAHATVEAEKAFVDASEARAREAAAQSDDPLRAGLDSLRSQ